VLITEAVAQRKERPIYFPRGQQHKFQSHIAAEEDEWDSRRRKKNVADDGPNNTGPVEEFRVKRKVVAAT
jgi:ATP-dependent Clp protease ATP-binding subunit ClpX